MAEKKRDIKKSILTRVRMLYLFMFMSGIAIAGKILYLQYGPEGEELRSKGEQISYERVTIPADRGDILANDGRILATSIPMYDIRMDFAAQGLADSVFNKYVDSLAYSLAQFYGDKSAAAYKNKLVTAHKNKKKNRYTLISPRRINYIELQTVKKFPIFRLGQNKGGFLPVQVNKRLLPHGSMASRTIGMVNASGTKVGIEGAFDTVLKGVDGNVMMQKISGSFRIPVPDELSVEPVDGIDVVSTIDVDVQDVAESALRKQLIDGNADWGTAILMEVETGEIRAISNLTRHSDGSVYEDFNYAIAQNLEPGSTIKLVSLLTLLDDAGASMDEEIDTEGGRAMVGRSRVVDTHNYGTVTLEEAFEVSSNIGFAKIVNKYYKDNPKKYVDHLREMGVDKPLELQIAGEQAPVLRYPGEKWWDGTTLVNMAYGYALRLTPLKTLSIYNAVANHGKMVRPIFVKELRQYGQTLRTYTTDVMVPRIATEATIEKVQAAMQYVVEEGTGRILKNPRYKVAAKTGTAQIAMGRSGYTDRFGGRHYLATLAGYFPADKPKYSCIVVMKTYIGPGRKGAYYGASLSGPVFKAIADRVYAQNTSWQTPVSKIKEKVDEQPSLKSGNMQEMRAAARRFKIDYEGGGRGVEWLSLQTDDSTGVLYTPVDETSGKVPSVIGMGLKEALFLLEREGLVVTFTGRGTVKSQSIKAGSDVVRGNMISLTLGT